MSRKYLLDCSANGAKWADDVQSFWFYIEFQELHGDRYSTS